MFLFLAEAGVDSEVFEFMGDSLLDHCFEAYEFRFRFKFKQKYDEWKKARMNPIDPPSQHVNTSHSNFSSPVETQLPLSRSLIESINNIPIIVDSAQKDKKPIVVDIVGPIASSSMIKNVALKLLLRKFFLNLTCTPLTSLDTAFSDT